MFKEWVEQKNKYTDVKTLEMVFIAVQFHIEWTSVQR